jgi:hypothetical protein
LGKREVFGVLSPTEENQLRRIVELYEGREAMMRRAREALACWSVVGRRLGVVRDIRIKIARPAWEEVELWRETRKVEALEPAKSPQSCALQ